MAMLYGICPNCREPGFHYVPMTMTDPAGWLCDPFDHDAAADAESQAETKQPPHHCHSGKP